MVGFVHDWANRENTFRSWDMVARYVIPEINGYSAELRESQKFLIDNRAVFERAGPGHHGQDHGEQAPPPRRSAKARTHSPRCRRTTLRRSDGRVLPQWNTTT